MDMIIFEDDDKQKLLPLVYMRGVKDLRCGIFTLEEKITKAFSRIKLPFSLLINAKVLPDEKLISTIKKCKGECIFADGDTIVAVVLNKVKLASLQNYRLSSIKALGLQITDIEANMVTYPWDLVHKNADQISYDFENFFKTKSKKNIFIGKNVVIKPGVVLDADEGPIVIDDGAKILANSVIMGPAYIGKGTTIKAIAKIYGGTSIGPVCKVGGEVEGSIFQAYSNKQHDGFLGHSYVCEWVNLGADTNNSDLKNNYSNVKVYNDGKMIDSGHMFVGLTIADHSKSGINTMFNTGTVVEVCCNVFGAGFPPKHIPSFSWGGAEGLVKYDIEKAIETARAVMKRRKVEMTAEYESKLRQIFNQAS